MMKKLFPLFLLLMLPSTASLARIAPDADSVSPLLNGQTLPDVEVRTIAGKNVSLMHLVAEKPSVVIFYRGGWCPYCNAQLSGLKEIEEELQTLGFQLLALSPDTPEKLQESVGERALNYTLLSDRSLAASEGFGLAFYLDEKTSALYRDKLGTLLVTENGGERVVLPVPAAYILDQDGTVLFNYVNPGYKVRVHPELLLHAARLAAQDK